MKRIFVFLLLMFISAEGIALMGQEIKSDVIDAEGVRHIEYIPDSRVCSKVINFEIKGDTIVKAWYTGGCPGNTKGISALIAGMKVDTAIEKLDGTPCGKRGTYCPDQMAKALKMIKEKEPETQKE